MVSRERDEQRKTTDDLETIVIKSSQLLSSSQTFVDVLDNCLFLAFILTNVYVYRPHNNDKK